METPNFVTSRLNDDALHWYPKAMLDELLESPSDSKRIPFTNLLEEYWRIAKTRTTLRQ